MKRLLSIILATVIFVTSAFGAGVTANAAVVYDTQQIKDTVNYRQLTIYGKNHYKYAFQCFDAINQFRYSDEINRLEMDKDMVEAAMLRAHELVAYFDAVTRPNGKEFTTLLDSKSNELYYDVICVSQEPNVAFDVAAYIFSDTSISPYVFSEDIASAGFGAFESEELGFTIWVILLSPDKAQQNVTAADYPTSVNKAEKIALHKKYWSQWDEYHQHKYVTYSTTPADAMKKTNGRVYRKCKTCGTKTSSVIYYPGSITLSYTSIYYSGSLRAPSVTVKDTKGRTLVKGTDYDVAYSAGRKNVGRYQVKVTFKGKYSGTKNLYYNIIPKGTSISRLTASSKGFKVQWNTQKTQTTGYQIQYSTSSKFENANTITMPKNTYYAKKITGRAGNKRYYVRVRTYKVTKFGGKNYNIYSPWSSAKYVTTKY